MTFRRFLLSKTIFRVKQEDFVDLVKRLQQPALHRVCKKQHDRSERCSAMIETTFCITAQAGSSLVLDIPIKATALAETELLDFFG